MGMRVHWKHRKAWHQNQGSGLGFLGPALCLIRLPRLCALVWSPRERGQSQDFIILKEKNVCSLFLSPTSSMSVCLCVYVCVHTYVHILSMYTFVWSWTNVHVWREEAIVMYILQSFSYLFSEEVGSFALVSPAAISWGRSSGLVARSMQWYLESFCSQQGVEPRGNSYKSKSSCRWDLQALSYDQMPEKLDSISNYILSDIYPQNWHKWFPILAEAGAYQFGCMRYSTSSGNLLVSRS